MSALAGRWNFDGNPEAAASCRRMLAAQQIYGPHDGAQWDDGGIALGRRLFRLLPEDAFDRQPLAGGGGRYRLVADLRLDNRDELARDIGLDPSRANEPVRRGDPAGGLGALAGGGLRPSFRRLCLCPVGRPRPAPHPGPRRAGRQAAALSSRRRLPRFRLDAERAARAR
jgi:hypothetical protein